MTRKVKTGHGKIMLIPAEGGLYLEVQPKSNWIHYLTEIQFYNLVKAGKNCIADQKLKEAQESPESPNQ